MNIYARAIEILTDENTNYKEIVINLAKTHPAMLVKMAFKTSNPAWSVRAKELYQAGHKVEAIKYCRRQTGMDLRTAREAVEDLL